MFCTVHATPQPLHPPAPPVPPLRPLQPVWFEGRALRTSVVVTWAMFHESTGWSNTDA